MPDKQQNLDVLDITDYSAHPVLLLIISQSEVKQIKHCTAENEICITFISQRDQHEKLLRLKNRVSSNQRISV